MRRVPLVVLLAGLVLLAGCGGGGGSGKPLSKAGYEQAVKSIVLSLGSSFQSITKGNSPAETAKKLAEAQSAIRKLADQLGGLKPPAEVAAAHKDLVDGLRQFADDLGGLDAKIQAVKSAKDPLAVFGVLLKLK